MENVKNDGNQDVNINNEEKPDIKAASSLSGNCQNTAKQDLSSVSYESNL